MERKIRGLEDRETHERKQLLRDVRTPFQQTLDGLKLSQVQTGGIIGAGVSVCLSRLLSANFHGRRGLFLSALLLRHP